MTISETGKQRLLKVAEYLENTDLPEFHMFDFGACVVYQLPNIFPEDWVHGKDNNGRNRTHHKKRLNYNIQEVYSDLGDFFEIGGIFYASPLLIATLLFSLILSLPIFMNLVTGY